MLNKLIETGESSFPIKTGLTKVFHLTSESNLAKIIKTGVIKPGKLIYDEISKIVEDIYDKYAPAGFSRKNTVFAYAEMENQQFGISMGAGEKILEILVDPDKVLVTDAEYFTEARRQPTPENIETYAEAYWEQAMTLRDFMSLPPEERKNKYSFPEVIIPGMVSNKFFQPKTDN